MTHPRPLLAAAFAMLLAGCAMTPPRAPLKLTVLHTNDTMAASGPTATASTAWRRVRP